MATPVKDVTSIDFSTICEKFLQFDSGNSAQDRQNLHTLLDELNALDFKKPNVLKPDEGASILEQCCLRIPPADTFLVAKGCQLIGNMTIHQQIPLDERNVLLIVNWCLKALRLCPRVVSHDILYAIEIILKGNFEITNLKSILPALESYLEAPPTPGKEQCLASPWDLRLQAMRCLEALVKVPIARRMTADEMSEILNICLKMFLSELEKDKHPKQDEINFCKGLIAAIGGVEKIIQRLGAIVLGEALGVVKAFMLYGLPGHTGLKPVKVPCAQVSHSELSSKLPQVSKSAKVSGRARPNRKRQKKKDSLPAKDNLRCQDPDNEDDMPYCRNPAVQNYGLPIDAWPRTSDSEFSDTEAGQHARVRHMQSRVRHAALSLMQAITNSVERKQLFGYWLSLLPDGPEATQRRTLFTCLRDPSAKSRLGVLSILWTMLNSSRFYLLQAEHGDGSLSAFTPFSVSLGNMLHELHRSLCVALSVENTLLVITQLLRVIAIMVENTPYHRLRAGLLSKLILSIRNFVYHSDVNVQVAALSALGCVVSVQPVVPELSEFVRKSTRLSGNSTHRGEPDETGQDSQNNDINMADGEENVEYEEAIEDNANEVQNDANLPWILEICLELKSHVPMPVRVARLQLISALANHHLSRVIVPNFSIVQHTLFACLEDSEETVRFHAARAVEVIGISIYSTFPGFIEGTTTWATPPAFILAFWKELLDGPLVQLLQSPDHPNLRASGCDILASIGENSFDHFPENKKIMCFTLLLGLALDEESVVRASAARALGVFVLFAALRKDMHFLVDCTESIISCAKDDSFGVKLKASWALGNLSDALVMNRYEKAEGLPVHFTIGLLKTSREAALDNEKIRSNGVRALGSLLRLITEEDLGISEVNDCVKEALSTLVKNTCCGSNMKVRWNACYALGNVLRNTALHDGSINSQAMVLPVLCSLVEKFRNFKVRINAAASLAIPRKRAVYGLHFLPAWIALLRGIDNSEYMADFNEYKHRDGLLDQICRSLCHLACLTTVDDLVALGDILNMHAASVKTLLQRREDSVVPERAGIYLAAASHTTKLVSSPGLTAIQLYAATLLQSVFTRDQPVA